MQAKSRSDGSSPYIYVPCGKCIPCMKKRASGWSFRLMQEEKVSSSAYFVTLTYDTENVPINEIGMMTLRKRDIQLWFKRLRKVNAPGLKYYCVGEYGGRSWRPHYHVILFNARVETIYTEWKLGNVHVGSVSGASVGYTLKYVSKGRRIPAFKDDVRVPEFSLMSKGLGKNYLTEDVIEWHNKDLDRMYVVADGKKVSMPRYYKDRLYVEDVRKAVGFRARKNMLERVVDTSDVDVDAAYLALQRKLKNELCISKL